VGSPIFTGVKARETGLPDSKTSGVGTSLISYVAEGACPAMSTRSMLQTGHFPGSAYVFSPSHFIGQAYWPPSTAVAVASGFGLQDIQVMDASKISKRKDFMMVMI
jgi:hypothetical protein